MNKILSVVTIEGYFVIDHFTSHDEVIMHTTLDKVTIEDNHATINGMDVHVPQNDLSAMNWAAMLSSKNSVQFAVIHHQSWVEDNYTIAFK